MSNKKIGIPVWNIGENSTGITKSYLFFASQFGRVRFISPEEDMNEVADQIDLLILPGGADLHPNSYRQVPAYFTNNPDVMKQHFFENCLDTFIEKNVPIFGICLGHQMLAVKFGHTIKQHMLYHPKSDDRGEYAHQVVAVPETVEKMPEYFRDLLTKDMINFPVNSLHHQCVVTKRDAKEYLPLFKAATLETKKEGSKPLGVIEGMIHVSKPIISVQWHPEELYDAFSIQAMHLLVDYKQVNFPIDTLETIGEGKEKR